MCPHTDPEVAHESSEVSTSLTLTLSRIILPVADFIKVAPGAAIKVGAVSIGIGSLKYWVADN